MSRKIDHVYFGLKLNRISSFFGSTRRKVAAVVVALALVGGAATGIFAYMLATGSGSGQYASTTPIQQPPTVALTVDPMPGSAGPLTAGPGNVDSTWSFTDHENFRLNIQNGTANPASISHINFAWSVNGQDMTSSPLGGTFTMTLVDILPQTVPANGNVLFSVRIDMVNLTGIDQSSLAGLNPVFTFSVS